MKDWVGGLVGGWVNEVMGVCEECVSVCWMMEESQLGSS